MSVSQIDPGAVRTALALAARAPSIHNSQPWRWQLGERTVHLRADFSRWLPATDADGRELLLSCGAALHHLRIALAALEIPATVERLPDPEQPDLLAVVHLGEGPVPVRSTMLNEEVAAIEKRRTDRRRYTDWPLHDEHVEDLAARAAEQGALLRRVYDGRTRHALEVAVRTAILQHTVTPGYATELATWTGLRSSPDGVPASAIPPHLAPAHGDIPTRPFPEGDLGDLGAAEDGATLLVLGTSSDDRLSQLRAGEAMSAVLLWAQSLGLATCPMSEPLEFEGTRALLRDEVLDGTLSPQLVLRVGWPPTGATLPLTPRRPLADQIEE